LLQPHFFCELADFSLEDSFEASLADEDDIFLDDSLSRKSLHIGLTPKMLKKCPMAVY
jgi:hypothetical protein